VSVNLDDFFEFWSDSRTRDHAYKLFKPQCYVIFIRFFAERVINVPSVVDFSTITSFRRTIQDVDFSSFIRQANTSFCISSFSFIRICRICLA